MPDLLSVRDLTVSVTVDTPGRVSETVEIVRGVSFDLERGKVLGLIGESGAGKSTIGLATLAYGRGRARITGGSIHLGGEDILGLPPRAIRGVRGVRVSYVAQSAASAFNPAHTLGDQVIEVTLRRKLATREEARARARFLFGVLGLPDPDRFGERYPHQVSGGQLQRAMTAMALCPNPELIVFDEPTTALDVTTQIDVLAAIKRAIATTGCAALYISHDLALVAQICDDIMVLRNGAMVEYGPTRQVIEAPRAAYTRALTNVRQLRKPEATGHPEILLSVDRVSASYDGRTPALHDVSLTVPVGRTLAVVGESGSGKSTLARVISGLMRPDTGTIAFGGTVLPPLLKHRSRDQLRRIQHIHQMADLALNPRHRVGDIIGHPVGFYEGLAGAARTARVCELLDAIEMGRGFLARYPAELSGGEKQRVAIARALAARPDLILCDEPTSALDPLVAEGVLRLLLKLQAETRVSYLFITHDINIVREVADSVAVLQRGRRVCFGAKNAVLTPPVDDYTDLLLKSVPEMRIGWLETVLATRRMASADA